MSFRRQPTESRTQIKCKFGVACTKPNCPYTHDSLTAMTQNYQKHKFGGPGFQPRPRPPKPVNQAPDQGQN